MQSFRQMLYERNTDFAALSSFTSEASLLSGNSQPWLPRGSLDFMQPNRRFRLSGRGVVSSTGTPTYTFKVRMGTTQAGISDTVRGATAALTTGSGISNALWEFWLEFSLVTPGIGTGNSTITSGGQLLSSGFSTPVNDLTPTNGSATWTSTCDLSVDNYINVSVICSANSASNTITLKHLTLEALD